VDRKKCTLFVISINLQEIGKVLGLAVTAVAASPGFDLAWHPNSVGDKIKVLSTVPPIGPNLGIDKTKKKHKIQNKTKLTEKKYCPNFEGRQ
jgi:hypothetical protein